MASVLSLPACDAWKRADHAPRPPVIASAPQPPCDRQREVSSDHDAGALQLVNPPLLVVDGNGNASAVLTFKSLVEAAGAAIALGFGADTIKNLVTRK